MEDKYINQNLLDYFNFDNDLKITNSDGYIKIFDDDNILLDNFTSKSTRELENNIVNIYNSLFKSGHYKYLQEYKKLLYTIHNYNIKNGIKTPKIEKKLKTTFEKDVFYVFNNIFDWYIIVNPRNLEWTDLQYIKEKNKICTNYGWTKIDIKKYYNNYQKTLLLKSNRRHITNFLLYIFFPELLTYEEENKCMKMVKEFKTKEELNNILKDFTKEY